MPTTTSNTRLPEPTDTSPLLRARYSTGYNDPIPTATTPIAGTSSWTQYTSLPALASAGAIETLVEMPCLMSFISLLPPSREMTYESMERVLPAGLSPAANGTSSSDDNFIVLTVLTTIRGIQLPVLAGSPPLAHARRHSCSPRSSGCTFIQLRPLFLRIHTENTVLPALGICGGVSRMNSEGGGCLLVSS